MAKATQTPTPLKPANLALKDIPNALAKLERRRKEFEAAEAPGDAGEAWDVARRLCTQLAATLTDIFGAGTIEGDRCSITPGGFANGYLSIMGEPYDPKPDFESGRRSALSTINAEITILTERLSDGVTASFNPLVAYEGLELHPNIEDAAGDLFRNGHYANAIEDAVKALNNLVRLKSGCDLDGEKLMQQAFSPSAPKLTFNDLADETDKDEQRGFMYMFSGAVAGLRNPRAHKLIKDDPERALEFIAFVSLLAKLVSAAKKVRS